MYYLPQNNYLATDGNCSRYDAQSDNHRPLKLSRVGGVTVVRCPVVDVMRVEKEAAFEELSLLAPRCFPVSTIPPTPHTHNSFLYHVCCRYRPIQSVPGIKVSISEFNSSTDGESKTSYTHGSSSQRFQSYEFLKHSTVFFDR